MMPHRRPTKENPTTLGGGLIVFEANRYPDRIRGAQVPGDHLRITAVLISLDIFPGMPSANFVIEFLEREIEFRASSSNFLSADLSADRTYRANVTSIVHDCSENFASFENVRIFANIIDSRLAPSSICD